jgi:hypothetical protein
MEIRRNQRTQSGPRKPKLNRSAHREEHSVGYHQKQPPHLDFLKRHQGTLPEIVSAADLVVVNAALHFLFAHLRQARRLFELEGDAGRLGAFTALGALWQLIVLFEKPSSETLQVPILRLQDALVSLDRNSVLPIVRPTRRRGRGASSHAHLALKGHVAGTVRRLVTLGLAQSDAQQKVAALLRGLGIRTERGSGHVTAVTVRNWFNEVSADVSRKGTAAVVFDDMLADADERQFATLSPAEARRFALASLWAWIQSLLPKAT